MKKSIILLTTTFLCAGALAQAQILETGVNTAADLADFDFLAADNSTGGSGSAGITAIAGLTDTTFQVGDYSTITAGGASPGPVPEAPNSDVGGGDTATTGLFFNTVAGSSPALGFQALFTGTLPTNYSVQFDYFNAYNGGGGSTENLLMITNATGSNYVGQAGGTDKDGYVLTAYGDIDVGADWRFGEGTTGGYEYDTSDSDTTPLVEAGIDFDADIAEVVWGDGTTAISGIDVAGNAYFESILPDAVSAGGTPLAGGLLNTWTTIKITALDGGIFIVEANGSNVITYNDADDTYNTGLPGFGHEDVFSGSPGATNYGIIDNIIISDESPSTAQHWEVYN